MNPVVGLFGSRRKARWLAVGALLAGLALTPLSTADAHHGSLIVNRLPTDPNFYNVHFYFDTGVPGGRTRSRIAAGARPWTKLGRQAAFVRHRRGIRGRGQDTCHTTGGGGPAGVVYWETVDGAGRGGRDILGFNANCVHRSGPHSGRLAGFNQVYDSKQPNWYRKTGNVPSDRLDLWSVATHEFGHAVGWGNKHYRNLEGTSSCAVDNPARETMCSKAVVGQSRTRTLGQLDKHVFRHIYRPR